MINEDIDSAIIKDLFMSFIKDNNMEIVTGYPKKYCILSYSLLKNNIVCKKWLNCYKNLNLIYYNSNAKSYDYNQLVSIKISESFILYFILGLPYHSDGLILTQLNYFQLPNKKALKKFLLYYKYNYPNTNNYKIDKNLLYEYKRMNDRFLEYTKDTIDNLITSIDH